MARQRVLTVNKEEEISDLMRIDGLSQCSCVTPVLIAWLAGLQSGRNQSAVLGTAGFNLREEPHSDISR